MKRSSFWLIYTFLSSWKSSSLSLWTGFAIYNWRSPIPFNTGFATVAVMNNKRSLQPRRLSPRKTSFFEHFYQECHQPSTRDLGILNDKILIWSCLSIPGKGRGCKKFSRWKKNDKLEFFSSATSWRKSNFNSHENISFSANFYEFEKF